jgi:hypothetical protein
MWPNILARAELFSSAAEFSGWLWPENFSQSWQHCQAVVVVASMARRGHDRNSRLEIMPIWYYCSTALHASRCRDLMLTAKIKNLRKVI